MNNRDEIKRYKRYIVISWGVILVVFMFAIVWVSLATNQTPPTVLCGDTNVR